MEYLMLLVQRDIIPQGAVDIAQSHRDPPMKGVFGRGASGGGQP